MQGKAVNVSLLFVVCIILIACGPSQAERNAQVTAIAASVFATETAAAHPTVVSTASPSSPTSLQLAGGWEGKEEWPGITFHISFSISEGSNEVRDLKVTFTCPGSEAPDGDFSFPPSEIEKDAFSAFGTEGKFVSSTKAEGTFDSGASIQCGQEMVPMSGEWVATKAGT